MNIYLPAMPISEGEFHTWSSGLRAPTDNFSEKDAACHDRMCRFARQKVKRI